MRRLPFLELALGLLFGAGLVVAGMAQPAKVLAFLDVAGAWDPSLALVMGGAIAVALPFFRAAIGRVDPASTTIDRRLVAGSALFGIGWGLVGFCPGPAVAALSTGGWKALLFVAAMVAGMILAEKTAKRTDGRDEA